MKAAGGSSVADHLASHARQTGGVVAVASTEPPPLGRVAAVLWGIWNDLNATRAQGFSSPQRIAYTEILARGTVLGQPLKPWAADAIRLLDDAFIAHVAENTPRPT